MGYNLKKFPWELGEKNEKGERKKEENYIKNGGKGLKNASFWAIISKKNRRGVFSWGKKMNLKRGGGEIIKMHNIYPCGIVKKIDS